MKIGIQEIVAICMVLAVVLFAIWRRWQRGRHHQAGCSGCDQSQPESGKEKTIHLYRRDR
ncbi:MAG: hypothetical protein KJO76_06655 [Gammaproteobacteria bacterium]|nr:hypothetical protein [Gammaproteobacteria bacterium]NND35988.1 hypothetical protein [Gammaproteobacteria bacterium]